MSRWLLVAGIWAVLIALVAALAHWAGPTHERIEPGSSAVSSAHGAPGAGQAAASQPRGNRPGSPARDPALPPTRTPADSASATSHPSTSNAPEPGTGASSAHDSNAAASAPTKPASEPMRPSPAVAQAAASGKTGIAAQGAPDGQRPKRELPQREGATESGIPGLGSLPMGPGAAYQGLGVQVYSRETGLPLVGARVRFALEAQLEEWQRAHPDTPIESADPEMVLQICTQPVQTRVGGVALTDSAPGRMLVDANMGRQYGFAWVDRDKDARARIDIVEDRAIAVHAKDESGVPRENVVALVRDSSCATVWRGVTDASGTALWRHASFLLERDASPGACVVMLEELASNPRFEIIQRPLVGARDIDFALVTRGALRLKVVDTEGNPVLEPLVVTCSTKTAAACGSAVKRTLVLGIATFERVEPGLELDVEIDGVGAFENSRAVVRGPSAAGETTITEVKCGRRLAVVRAKLAGADGAPLAKTKANAWLEFDEDGRARSLPAMAIVESDEAGAVRFVLPHAPSSAKAGSILIVAQNEFFDWCFGERVPLATKLDERGLDLGERKLSEMPTIAAGYVLADKGWPVPNSIVEVSASDDPTADPETFTADLRFSAVADQLGRFRLRGFVPGARVALTASAPDHSRPPRRIVERGERKVSLELPRSAAISGKLFPPTGISHEHVRVWVDRADESIPAGLSSNLTWRCAGLAPGTAAVRVMIDGFPEPVFALPSVRLEPGIEISDLNTTTIDLRTHVTRFVLRVLDAAGMPIPRATAVITEPREEGPYARTVEFEQGILEVIALRPEVDVEIRASGFETLVLRAVSSATDVRLASSKGN